MKWPAVLLLVRHGESWFNEMQKRRRAHPFWQEFIKEFDKDYTSPRTRELAEEILRLFPQKYPDYETPLTERGKMQAQKTGLWLKEKIEPPHVVIVSPYLRCRETLVEMTGVWPELKNSEYYTDELVAERDIGEAIRYGNWRLFYVFHPEQKEVYDSLGTCNYYFYRYPQGQNIPDMRLQTRIWTGTLTREFSGKRVLVVMHHLRLLAIRANLERMTPEEFLALDNANPPKNCSVTIYRGEPRIGRAGQGKLVLEDYNLVVPGNKEESEEK